MVPQQKQEPRKSTDVGFYGALLSGETRVWAGGAMIFSGVIRVNHRSWLFMITRELVKYSPKLFLVVRRCP